MDENKRAQKYAYLNYLSTSELENILRADLDAPESDPERTLYILEVIERRDPEHAAAREADTDRAWEEFQAYYDVPEGQDRTLYPSEPPKKKLHPAFFGKRHPRLRQAALIAAMLALLMLGASALGFDGFSKMIGLWTDEEFHFVSTGSAASSTDISPENMAYESLEEALNAYDVIEHVCPRFIPKGFQQVELIVENMPEEGYTDFHALYANDNSSLSITISKNTTPQYMTYEKDKSPVEIYEQLEIPHYFYQNINSNAVAWVNGSFECLIQGEVTLDELKEMVNSIYER